MSLGVLNAAMLSGLLGVSVPLIIHVLNRRRDPVVDWGAMQFLEIGRKARQKLRLTELLLMLARMGMLALVALALARPFWGGSMPNVFGGSGHARDIVLILDGSASMDRRLNDGAGAITTPRERAILSARQFLSRLKPGDSVAVLVAGDRVRNVIDPPSFDLGKVDVALAELSKSRGNTGSSEMTAALAEAFRILERTQNPAREVLILGDAQRNAWRPGESARWALVRDLHQRLPVPPRIWSLAFGMEQKPDSANGSVGMPSVSRALVTPGLPLTVSADVRNSGPNELRSSAELLVDGQPTTGSAQAVGPIPEKGRARVEFRTSLLNRGSHLLTIKLIGDEDSLPGDDESSVAVQVAQALPVLLIDGEPGLEPLSGETDFLRAALAPSGDDTPQVKANVLKLEQFKTASLQGQSVLVMANVERLNLDQAAAVARFVEGGGGVLIAPGDRTDVNYFNSLSWMPARLGERTGDFGMRKVVAHPAPASFTGPVLSPFAQGETPPLAGAGLFAYRRLEPAVGAFVSARLDSSEPWAVEHAQGKGRIILLAGPLDAEGGTLAVNPDFVPLIHEWVFHLAGGSESRTVKPGEALIFDLDPAPSADVTALAIQTPSGKEERAVVTRAAELARARFEDTVESGIYRLTLPDPPGGFAYGIVPSDERESEPEMLLDKEEIKLADGWPLFYSTDLERLTEVMLVSNGAGRQELWRGLVLAALGGLCVEIYLTRRLVRGQGLSAN